MDMGENHRYGSTDLRYYYYMGDHMPATPAHNARQQHYGSMIQPVGDHPEFILATHSTGGGTTTPTSGAAAAAPAATSTGTAAAAAAAATAAAGAAPFQPPPPPHLTKMNGTCSSEEPQQHIYAFGGGFQEEGGCGINPQGRWPRQETLTLLEVRSRLDPKFKGSAHKTPLWDEVSRIMAEEHGYRRSGKKCREKLENLYKYYKKTKEGRAGRQDGKHYRFFRQLDALYGENNTTAGPHIHMSANDVVDRSAASAATPKLLGRQRRPTTTNSYYDPNKDLVLVNSTETSIFSSSEEEDEVGGKGKPQKGRGSWKAKIKQVVDEQVKRFVEAQETWFERMLRTMESKERERFCREEEWRRREAERVEGERRYWAGERAWMQARDALLIQALEKVIRGGGGCIGSGGEATTFMLPAEEWGDNERSSWSELEITSLIKLREGMRWGFRDDMWHGISAGMSEMGYERSAGTCKEKWEDMHRCLWKIKRLKDSAADDDMQGRRRCVHGVEQDGGSNNLEPSPPASDDGCLHFLIEGETLWDQHQAAVDDGDNDDNDNNPPGEC